ncbi:hypothetical protein [Acidovorax sp. SUPP3334]|uniref:hypothetical protein n=1 Tax=Acidovorax sp. SUPP3334 TaxID=2920881 RepID=UPI0023DE31C1|nr:hypothetical protein [Acidovorax sp. SUPP3334]GKT24735.1 hypothetical protein AVHM3334_15695 [Acidovorax sp. SUPP3334]
MWEEPIGKMADLRQVCMPESLADLAEKTPFLQWQQADEARVQLSHADVPARQLS